MRIKKNLTLEQITELLPILVKFVNYSVNDIESFKELTPSEKEAFNNDEELFNKFFTKNSKNGK